MSTQLIILHIARLNGDASNGVNNAVPMHVTSQQKYANIFLLNTYACKDIKKQLWEYLHSLKRTPDIVIFHEVYRLEYIYISKRLKKLKIPYVVIPHGSLTREAQKKGFVKKTIANIFLYHTFLKNASAIQCLTESEANSIKFKTNKVIGANGIAMPTKVKTSFSDVSVKLVYIGRMDVYHKGLDLLIAAAKECKKFLQENNCKIYIYGPNKKNRHEYVRQLIDNYQVNDVVCLRDGVFGEEKEKVLLDADYFIQTSRSEGLPLGVLEALSYGVPCILTQGTRICDVVEKYDAGWCCKTSISDITQVIMRAIDERSLLQWKAQNAIRLILENYEWDHVSKENVKIYQNLVLKAIHEE